MWVPTRWSARVGAASLRSGAELCCSTAWQRRFAATWGGAQSVPRKSGVTDFYMRLGVEYSATESEIKAAYRKRALQCHPDVVAADAKSRAEVEFRGVSEAYDVLADPRRRRQHDEELGVTKLRAREEKERADVTVKERAGAARATDPAPASASAPSASKKAASSRSRSSGGFHSSRGKETERSTSSTRNATAARQSSPDGGATRRSKVFVRGDADRLFREAFEGKTLDQVLFEERWRLVREAKRRAAKSSVAEHRDNAKGDSTPSEKPSASGAPEGAKAPESGGSSDAPTGREEVLRRVMFAATEQFAANMQRQYGPSVLKHIKVTSGRPFFPKAPPSTYMPFRPFHGMRVPEGVTTPPDPQLGPLSTVSEQPVESFVEQKPLRWLSKGLPQETPDGRKWWERTWYVERQRLCPHNMGMLYSYQRPY